MEITIDRKLELHNWLYADGNISHPDRKVWAEELAQIEAEELAQNRANMKKRELEIIEKVSSYSKEQVFSEAVPYCCPIDVRIEEGDTQEEAEHSQLVEAFEFFFDGMLPSWMKVEDLIKYLK